MIDFTLENAEEKHLQAILEIEKTCFSSPWTLLSLENQISSKNSIFIVAFSGERVLGYAGMMTVLDEGYISNIAVAPDFRRQGIASALISELINRTRDILSFITLEVRKSNSAAVSLYNEQGFAQVGVRKNYYDKPKEDAVLMTLFLKAEENN